MKKIIITVLLVWGGFTLHMAQDIIIENEACRLVTNLRGAKMKEFSLKAIGLNPIHEYAHFICFDRWGPSEDDGIPWHGNGQRITWQLNQDPVERQKYFYAEISGILPVVNLKMNRKIYLDKTAPVARVVEKITNPNEIEKVFNLVQHPTIGAPFLDETTIVDTKVLQGFSQKDVIDSQPDTSQLVQWPQAFIDGKHRDLRYLNGTPNYEDAVVSFIPDKNDSFGWVTAMNASQGFLIGYLWEVSDYPWLNFWLMSNNNKPEARGLEFGTTGLHQPWSVVLERDSLLGQRLYETIDAHDSVAKSYVMFLAEIPNDFKGVESVAYDSSRIRIFEYDSDPDRTVELKLSAELTDVSDMFYRHTPDQITLEQNYPNPFNSRTKISFSVPVRAPVSMNLYDITGRHIKTLLDSEMTQGHHTITLEMEGLPGGIYLCQLQAGDHRQLTQKLTYIK